MIPRNFDDFISFLDNSEPLAEWPLYLKALWYDAKGDWDTSHNIAQDLNTNMGSWIHAYLHRKEDDEWNARFWYRQAGLSFPKYGLEEELKKMVEAALN